MGGFIGSKNERSRNGIFHVDATDCFRGYRALLAIAFVAALAYSAPAHAENCRALYNAIKTEAMYCGFFCDLGHIQQSQSAYETACIRIVVPASLFDLDSAALSLAPLAIHGEMTETTISSERRIVITQ